MIAGPKGGVDATISATCKESCGTKENDVERGSIQKILFSSGAPVLRVFRSLA